MTCLSGMPTVKRIGAYRLYFYASDGAEPMHVHVVRDDLEAKFWILPVLLAYNNGYPPKELRQLERIVRKEQIYIGVKWNEFFRNT